MPRAPHASGAQPPKGGRSGIPTGQAPGPQSNRALSLGVGGKALLLGIAYLLGGISLAQSLTFGLYGRLSPGYFTPTLELTYPIQDTTWGVRLQRDAFGVSAESALDLGPVGRIAYGGRASLGWAGWGVQAFARGGAGPVAAEARLGYASTPPASLWVGDADPLQPVAAGFSGLLSGRYRLTATQTLGFSAQYFGILAAEATLGLRDQSTYTVGLGYQEGLYGLLGWRGELDEAGDLLDLTLRAGGYNRLEVLLSMPLEDTNKLNLRFTVAYPWAAKLGIEMGNIQADAAFDGGWSAWLRYRLEFGGE